jgi:hypothetical protein
LAIRIIGQPWNTAIRQILTTGNASAAMWEMNSMKSANRAAQTAPGRYESGKPVIITDFLLRLAKKNGLPNSRSTMALTEIVKFLAHYS